LAASLSLRTRTILILIMSALAAVLLILSVLRPLAILPAPLALAALALAGTAVIVPSAASASAAAALLTVLSASLLIVLFAPAVGFTAAERLLIFAPGRLISRTAHIGRGGARRFEVHVLLGGSLRPVFDLGAGGGDFIERLFDDRTRRILFRFFPGFDRVRSRFRGLFGPSSPGSCRSLGRT
jgi:hypothetical protein